VLLSRVADAGGLLTCLVSIVIEFGSVSVFKCRVLFSVVCVYGVM
jgi:hypothetical protein